LSLGARLLTGSKSGDDAKGSGAEVLVFDQAA
jgi:hypothetical protein